jgi:tetratricopeptide (TPR) repeat protein
VQAQAALERAVSIWERGIGPGYVDLVLPLSSLGSMFEEQEKYEEAAAAFERAVSIKKQFVCADHDELLDLERSLAAVRKLLSASRQTA